MPQRDSRGGASLIGVVVVLLVLGGLAALSVTVLPDAGSRIPGLMPEDPASGLAQPYRPASPASGAAAASCLSTARVVATAAAAKHSSDGSFPASVSELVAGGWLSEAPALRGYDMRMEMAAGRPTGRVLVNDLPADQGCAAAPRPGP